MRVFVWFAGLVSMLVVLAIVVPCLLQASEIPQTSQLTHYLNRFAAAT